MIQIIRKLLVNIIERIDAGNTNISSEEGQIFRQSIYCSSRIKPLSEIVKDVYTFAFSMS